MPVSFCGQADVHTGTTRRILCYGDSLTAGFAENGKLFEPYGRSLADKLSSSGTNCEVFVCGLSGKTAREMVSNSTTGLVDVVGNHGKGLSKLLEEDGPFDLVIIMSGTNDMGQGAQEPNILQDVRSLHVVCHDRGIPTIALAPPPAPCAGAAREVARLRFVEQLQAKLIGMRESVACVDPEEFVPASNAQFWERDGLHFSPSGSKHLGKAVADIVADCFSVKKGSYATGPALVRTVASPLRARVSIAFPQFPSSDSPTVRQGTVGTSRSRRDVQRPRSSVAMCGRFLPSPASAIAKQQVLVYA